MHAEISSLQQFLRLHINIQTNSLTKMAPTD